ncbi:MAG: transposase family protein, partial [Sphingomonadales bacterium]|nr:transposase family protein [Sphingomonadales bacterium]
MSQISDNEILNLWRDIDFPASFRGVKTFQAVLKTDRNIDVPEKRLKEVLRQDPIFLIHQIKPQTFDRRKYVTHNYGELVQADLAYMFPDSDTKEKYFVLVIDVYSSKIFVEIVKSKESKDVAGALLKIFKEFKAPIYEIQTDSGQEFKGKACQDLFKKFKVLFRTKRPPNKANFAEAAIFRVKRKLYMYLRSSLKQNWASYIQGVVQGLNLIPQR